VSNPSRLLPNPGYGNWIQFAVGGIVYPPAELWIKITERFRGSTLKRLIALLSDGRTTAYEGLEMPEKEELTLLLGKHGDGRIAEGHRHAHFLLWPDETGSPSRLVVWRRDTLLSRRECDAMLFASELPISWGTGSADWQVRLVPLPAQTPMPRGFCHSAVAWRSVTPFVPPAGRHRFRKTGRERPSESVKECLRRLLEVQGLPAPESISVQDSGTKWLQLHQTLDRRRERAATRTAWVRPGFVIEMRFGAPVQGPIIAGDSSHFGLGLFRAME
jgi:CRISPR-associated protein Csb2